MRSQSLFLLFIFAVIATLVIVNTEDTLPYSHLMPITPDNAQQVTQIGQLGYGDVTDINWRDNGQTLAVHTTAGVYLHDMTTPDAPPQLQGNGNLPVGRMSPDGRILIRQINWNLEFLDGETGFPIREPIEGLRYCGWGVNPIWTHVVIHCHGNAVRLYAILESEVNPSSPTYNLNPFGSGGGIVIDAFSADGSLYVATIEDVLRFFCLDDGDYRFGCINPLPRNYLRDVETLLRFSPDNQYLLAHQFVSRDEESQINIMDLETGEMLFETIIPIFIHHLIFSPNGDYIVAEGGTTGETQILVWQMEDILNGNTDPATIIYLESVPQPTFYNKLAFSPDGTRLALATRVNQLFIWDTSGTLNTWWSTPLVITSYLSGDRLSTHNPFALHPDGTHLAYADLDESVVIIDITD